jgi:hypothetical protein
MPSSQEQPPPTPEGGGARPHLDSATSVRQWLEKQGYAVEHRTADAFAAMGFISRQGLTYRDSVEGKPREVDVVARAALTAHRVEMQAVVECKRSAKPWVTRTTRASTMRKGNVTWRPIMTPAIAPYLREHPVVLSDTIRLTPPIAFDVVETHRDDPKSGNPAYAALAQVISAASGLLADHDLFPNPTLFHPVVVLDGELFRATFGNYPDLNVEPIDRERIHWSGGQSVEAPVVIDVVRLSAIDEYVKDLRFELGELAETLELANVDFTVPAGDVV